MSSRLWSFVIWAAVAASTAFWGLRLLARPAQAPAHAVSVALGGHAGATGADLNRVLGAPPPVATAAVAPPPTDSRFKLLGVVAPRRAGSAEGLALISIDGKPPKAIGLGGAVDGSLVLLTVGHRKAELGPAGGGAQVTLELPAVPEPTRSTLPPAMAGAAAAPVTPSLPPMPATAVAPAIPAAAAQADNTATAAMPGVPAAVPSATAPIAAPAVPLPPALRRGGQGSPGATTN